MRSIGSTTLTLPPFAGSTRKLVLANLTVFLLLGVLSWVDPHLFTQVILWMGLRPSAVFHGAVWQVLTYPFVNVGLLGTALSLLTLWFTASMLEDLRGSRWLLRLYYGAAVAGSALALLLTLPSRFFPALPFASSNSFYFGMVAPLFAVLVAFGILYAEVEFLFFFVVRLKAKYLVAIMVLWRVASLLWKKDIFPATVELCCGFMAYLYVRYAKTGYGNRPLTASLSERYFAMRNGYYRWKRRRAAKSFQVYMKKQNREVHFDNEGRYVSPEDERRRDPNDKRWMN